ncbi:MAG: hypothetical protein QOD42_3005 [Sphingomonadales bacterium]|jgi:hypothetical protein|nr:hypothetical protein [Sphingomonadales bacterium]
MKRLRILLPLVALVAACARPPDRIQHGRWELEIATTEIDAPGLPAELQQQARAALNQTKRECVTPDNAAANPLRVFWEQSTSNPGLTCQTSENVFSGGVIRFRSSCRNSDGTPGQLRVALDGRYEAITLLASMSLNAEAPNPNGSGTLSVRTRSTIRGRRVGDCARN